MYLDDWTGRGVRIAIVDSGVHEAHPHVNGVAAGLAIDEDGTWTDDYTDRLGHGTAVGSGVLRQQRNGVHRDAGDAEPALRGLMVEKRLLHRVQSAFVAEPLDGHHVPAFYRPQRRVAGRHAVLLR